MDYIIEGALLIGAILLLSTAVAAIGGYIFTDGDPYRSDDE